MSQVPASSSWCHGRIGARYGQVRWGADLAGCLACLYLDDPDQRGDVITPEGVLVPGKLIGINVSRVAGN